MKTTLDLPNELVREMKLRAAHEGRKIKDVVASLLVSGLAAESAKKKATLARKGTLDLPLFKCAKNAPARRMGVEGFSRFSERPKPRKTVSASGCLFEVSAGNGQGLTAEPATTNA